jgi:DNA-binding response OmpR family regulator
MTTTLSPEQVAATTRVLIIEDDPSIAEAVRRVVAKQNGTGVVVSDGRNGLRNFFEERPDLVVLDIGLPGFDGFEVLRHLREFSDAYVVMLTARDEEADKVTALTEGADDYVVKPFSARELIARLQAMQRRPRAPDRHGALHLADLTIDVAAHVVHQGGTEVALTRTEFSILTALIDRRGSAMTRRQLIDEVWGAEWFGDEQVVDVHVGHLRRKLGDDAAMPRYVRTVRGVGYAAANTARA